MTLTENTGKAVLVLSILMAVLALPAQGQENPYETVQGIWAELPDGRIWGATSAVYYAGNGDVWVAERCGGNGNCLDTPNIDPVLLISQEGKIIRSFGSGQIVWPHGMHVDKDGNVWITDGRGDEKRGKGHQVLKFSPDGKLLMALGQAGKSGKERYLLNQPADVATAVNGDIFVADGHGQNGNNRIVKYNAKGEYLMEWGSSGAERGEFYEPHTIALDSKGRVFVGDRYNNRIQIFDQAGNHLDAWSQFGRPSGLYIDENDILYCADSESNSGFQRNPGWQRGIRIGSAETGWVSAFIPDPYSGVARATNVAEGVTADEDGNVYGAEVAQRMLRKYIPKRYISVRPPRRNRN